MTWCHHCPHQQNMERKKNKAKIKETQFCNNFRNWFIQMRVAMLQLQNSNCFGGIEAPLMELNIELKTLDELD